MLELFPDICYYMGTIRKMGGYQRVKISRRLSEGRIVVMGKCLERGCPDTAVILNDPVFATCPSFLTITFLEW